MEKSSKAREKNEIQTFVFLDLEATGLSGDDPRILEIAMIAVSREDLLSMKSSNDKEVKSSNGIENSATHPDSAEDKQKASLPHLPRVVHKYVRLYYPRKLITPKLEEITGLNNDLLHRLPGFSRSSADAIRLFLDFPEPVSLVAHNGGRYDFPLLKAELNNVGCTEMFHGLQCVDTLKAFKDIDAVHRKEVHEIEEITELAVSFSFEDLDVELMEEEATKKARCEEPLEKKVNQAFHGTCISGPSSQAMGDNQRILEVSAIPLLTPVKDIPTNMNNIPATPHKPRKHLFSSQSTNALTPGTPDFNPQTFTDTTKVRRTLSYGGNGKRKRDVTKSYKQIDIYERLFDRSYEVHKAEADCTAMLQICGHYGKNFVKWADSFADKFVDVKPMWTKRKSFQYN